MGAPSKKLLALAAAAEAYGDAITESQRRLYSWQRGDPPPVNTAQEQQHALLSAARAYATSTRRKRPTTQPPEDGEKR